MREIKDSLTLQNGIKLDSSSLSPDSEKEVKNIRKDIEKNEQPH